MIIDSHTSRTFLDFRDIDSFRRKHLIKEHNYDDLEDLNYAKILIKKYQKDAIDLNKEVREVRQRLIQADTRIEKLKELYYLRLTELIEETK